MNKRMLTGLALAAVLAVCAAAAPAEAMTCREIVEQVAVPLALENDDGSGINHSYSAEELAELARVMEENGIILKETDTVAQMVKNGHGCYEEATIRAYCDRVFGAGGDGWSLEEQAWYGQILVQIGVYEESREAVPGPDNLTLEEAEAFAFGRIREACGQDLPLEDRSIWRRGAQFLQGDREDPKPRWNIWLEPVDMEHGRYSVEFREGEPPEQASVYADVPDWTKPYTDEELMMGIRSVYGWSQADWTQAVWQELHERMQQAQLDPGGFYYRECNGYRITEYPEPDRDDISREEAIRIARAALDKDRAALDSAVLTEYAGERAWLVALAIYGPMEGRADEDPESGRWVITVDSRTGDVRSVQVAWGERAYIPEAAYEEAGKDIPRDDTDYVAIAAEAVKAQYPDADPLDSEAYTVRESGDRTHWVEFRPKSIRQGMITVGIAADGRVEEMEADAGPLTGDNLFSRYRNIYGYFADWDQALWVQLEKDMAGLEDPVTVEGQALKATHYPEESSVRIGRGEAKALGIAAVGERTAEAHTCVLVDAQPHPVWIMRVITQSLEDDPVLGIDAETGKAVFTEWYVIDETPLYVMYSLPETWRRLTGTAEAPTPTPRPDGKPWYWGMDFAPQEYWDRAGAAADALGVTAGNFDVLARKWDREFGGYDFVPQEYQVMNCLFQITEEDLKDPDFEVMLLPDPEKKTQQEIEAAARGAVHALADAEKGTAWADSLKAGATLYRDSRNPDREGENYGKHVWWVWFYARDPEGEYWSVMEAYAILDEDGNVLTSGLGEI